MEDGFSFLFCAYDAVLLYGCCKEIAQMFGDLWRKHCILFRSGDRFAFLCVTRENTVFRCDLYPWCLRTYKSLQAWTFSMKRKEWLKSIEAVQQKVLSGEARTWLITDLSSLDVPSHVQVDSFLDVLQNSMGDGKRNGDSLSLMSSNCRRCQSALLIVKSLLGLWRM